MEQLKYPQSELRGKICNQASLASKASRVLLDLSCGADMTDSIFDVKKPPKVGLDDYLNRIIIHSEMEESTLIIGIILIDRLTKEANLKISQHNIHRVLMAALVVALKLNEDIIYTDKEYAAIGGINLNLLIELEMSTLKLLNWRVQATNEEFELYKTLIESY